MSARKNAARRDSEAKARTSAAAAGWGSTLVAARNASRIAIGSEVDPDAHARCQAAIAGDMRAYDRGVVTIRARRWPAKEVAP